MLYKPCSTKQPINTQLTIDSESDRDKLWAMFYEKGQGNVGSSSTQSHEPIYESGLWIRIVGCKEAGTTKKCSVQAVLCRTTLGVWKGTAGGCAAQAYSRIWCGGRTGGGYRGPHGILLVIWATEAASWAPSLALWLSWHSSQEQMFSRFPRLQHQFHLGTWWKCKLSVWLHTYWSVTLGIGQWGWGGGGERKATSKFSCPPENSDKGSSLRITGPRAQVWD